MYMRVRLVTTLFLLLFTSMITTTADAQSKWRVNRALKPILADDQLDHTWYGILVIRPSDGKVLFERNADRFFMPASNTKLYTSAAALELLGPDYTYTTRLFAHGTQTDTLFAGDLVLVGDADPTFLSPEYEPNPETLFAAWADSLKAAGITHIAGDIIGDGRIIEDDALAYGWSWDDAPYYYAAEIGGLSAVENSIQVRYGLMASDTAMQAIVAPIPAIDGYATITATVSATDGRPRRSYSRSLGGNDITLSASVPPGFEDTLTVTIHDPAHFTAHLAKTYLTRAGITIDGAARSAKAADPLFHPQHPQRTEDVRQLQQVASYQSVPMSEIAGRINKPSNNMHAEQVLRTIARQDTTITAPIGNWRRGWTGSRALLEAAGIDPDDFHLVDGSGLSRNNLVTPTQTGNLLRYMWAHPDTTLRRIYYDSLPISGVDGTIRNRMKAPSPAFGVVRAKTGTLGSVSALSGYVGPSQEESLIFVIMMNHFAGASSTAARNKQDEIAAALARLTQ